MNIDIVNKQVSKKLGITEKRVALINKFYWRSVYDHFYSYDPQPINIENVCVFHNEKHLVRKALKFNTDKIRKTRISPKFKIGSILREAYIERYRSIFRKVWAIRKAHKYTNNR